MRDPADLSAALFMREKARTKTELEAESQRVTGLQHFAHTREGRAFPSSPGEVVAWRVAGGRGQGAGGRGQAGGWGE